MASTGTTGLALCAGPDALQVFFWNQQLSYVCRSAGCRWPEGALVDELAVEDDFGVTVPLNSSKITSSMREPVSMRAVAMMVSEPPSSMLRADPKKRFGALQCVGIDAAGEDFAAWRNDCVVGAGKAGNRIEQDDHVALVLDQSLCFFDHHFRDLHVAGGGLVEGRRKTSPLTERLHVVTSSGRSSISSTISTTSGDWW